MKYLYICVLLMFVFFIVSCKKETPQNIEVVKAKDSIKIETPITKMAIEIKDSIKKDNWLYYQTPSKIHKMMLEQVGIWRTEMIIYQGEDKEPARLIGEAEIKMMLGNRFQETIYTGYINSMPYEARSTLAYDDVTKEYTSTSISNIDTDMSVYKGRYNPVTKKIIMNGKITNTSNGELIPSRRIITMGPNIWFSETFITFDNKELKIWEISMIKKK